MTALAHNTNRSGPNKDIPVVIEDPTYYPFEPGEREQDWHEASDEEVQKYETYWDNTLSDNPNTSETLEYLRLRLREENISQGELIELQGRAEFIEPGDVELLEAAGVPEFPEVPEKSRWDEDADFPVSDWQYEVSNDDTRLGYTEWVSNQKNV